jgi:hypothetical protein
MPPSTIFLIGPGVCKNRIMLLETPDWIAEPLIINQHARDAQFSLSATYRRNNPATQPPDAV